jgi:glyoxylase-like metal-dependent hydrolase (beta-lactamase superfamily II)
MRTPACNMDTEFIDGQQRMVDPLHQITDHIWFFPPHSDPEVVQPGVGIILTPSETILVDAGSSPRHARQIRAVLREMEAPPVRTVIYTHHHWDHTFGGQIWDGCQIIAHEQCRALLHEHYGSQPWGHRYIQEQSYLNPAWAAGLRAMDRAVDDWGRFQLKLPNTTFTNDLTLFVNERTFHLVHVGGRHAPDSIVVEVNGVIFAGDCFYPPPLSVRQPGDTLDFAMIERLLARNAAAYIDAHGSPRTHAEFARLLDERH